MENRNLTATYLRSGGLGVLSGMRTMAGLVAARRGIILRDRNCLEGTLLAPLSSRPIGALMAMAAGGELVLDKLPILGPRIEPSALMGRAVAGATAGAIWGRCNRGRALTGGVLGAIGAVVGAYAAYHLRRAATERLGLPDAVVAIAEDISIVAMGRRMISRDDSSL